MQANIIKISYITVLSFANSLLSFIFQLIIAKVFGVGTSTDVFFLAFAVPEWVMHITLLIIPVTMIPVLSGLIANGEEKKAWHLINSLLTLAIIALGLLVLILLFLNNRISHVIAGNLNDEAIALYRELSVFLIPVLLFASLSAILTGAYYSYGKYLAPNISPIIQTAIMIAGVLLFNKQVGIKSAAISMLTGSIIRFAFLVFMFENARFGLWKKNIFTSDVKSIFKMMVPLLIGNVILKSGVLVDRYLASFLATGSISYLYYASRFTRLMARFTSQGVRTVYFPQLSKAVARRDKEDFQTNINHSLSLVLFIVLVVFGSMLLFGRNIIYVLFSNARFTLHDVARTAIVLTAFGGVLLAAPNLDIVNNIYYSLKDTKTPIVISTSFFIIGIIIKLVFLNIWGFVGIAIAASIEAILNVIFSLGFLRHKRKDISYKHIIDNLKKNIISFSIAFGCVFLIIKAIFADSLLFFDNKIVALFYVVIFGVIFAVLYIILNAIFGHNISKGIICSVIKKRT